MKIKSINYHKVFNLGNYSNEKIGVEIEIGEADDPVVVHLEAVKYVEKAHLFQKQIPQYNRAKEVVSQPMRYNGFQIEDANKIIADFEVNFKDYIAAYGIDSLKAIPSETEY